MRIRIAAGNWKMNTNLGEGKELAYAINNFVKNYDLTGKAVILGVPFTHLTSVAELVDFTKIKVAAQNCAMWEKGAFTGEISPEMIASTGAHYVIIGHSERRQYFGEVSAQLLTKIQLSLKYALFPIFCCGELLEERESGQHFNVVKQQLEETVFTLSKEDFGKVIIAYEPVWAIGTGKTASPAQAQEMHAFIRTCIGQNMGISAAVDTPILYGGSCNAGNAVELFSQPDVDGGLIGGASLKSDEFIEIIKVL